jgi:predicted dehydrogenase
VSEFFSTDFSRRDLLSKLAKGAAVAAVPAWFTAEAAAAESELALTRQRRFGPNDTINIAVIGPGGPRGGYRQGFGDTNHLRSKPGVKVLAVCDVDSEHRDWAANQFGPETSKYSDYRELLRDRRIDAVVIGTPDHWHSTISIDALKAGKDVYCEKPLTLCIQEGIDVVKHVGRRVFQTGSQQRSDARFRLACELVRNGRVGKLLKITTHLPTGPTGGPFETKPVPAGFDWNMWLGPAPMTDYIPERTHGSFRWWLEYSGGMLTDWGAHHNDIAQWALGMDDSGPVSVQGTAKSPPNIGNQNYNTFPEFEINYRYANGVPLVCTNTGENGVMFEGDAGWIFVSRETIRASDKKLLEEPLPANATKLYVSNDHGQNFLDCMRSRQQPICNAQVGHRSVTVCHLANISLMLNGRKLAWDPKAERFPVDGEAQNMVARPQRNWAK